MTGERQFVGTQCRVTKGQAGIGDPKQRRRVASVASDLQAEADSLRRQRDNAVRFDRNCQHSRVSERKFRI